MGLFRRRKKADADAPAEGVSPPAPPAKPPKGSSRAADALSRMQRMQPPVDPNAPWPATPLAHGWLPASPDDAWAAQPAPSPAPQQSPPRAPAPSTPPSTPPPTNEIQLEQDIQDLINGEREAEPKNPAPVPAAPTPPAPVQTAPPEPVPDHPLMERLDALEKGMSGLKNVQDLSELLSTKYNPFLDVDEEEIFESKHSTGDLLRARMSKGHRKPAWAQPSPGFEETWSDLPSIPTQTMPETPPPAARQVISPAEVAQMVAPERPVAAAPVPPESPAPAATRGGTQHSRFSDARGATPSTMYGSKKQHAANARESFLAMHWFTYLSEGTNPSIIFLYLDYYRYVGWIDEESYQWLWKLAEGVASPKQGAEWADFGMDVQQLSSRHLRNLRFIDKLLGTTLQHGEADYLRQTADMLLMEE